MIMRYTFVLLFVVLGFLDASAQSTVETPSKNLIPDTIQSKKMEAAPIPETESLEEMKRATPQAKKAKFAESNSATPQTNSTDSETLSTNKTAFYYQTFQNNYSASKTQNFQRTPTPSMQSKMEESAIFFQNTFPGSFEANFFGYRASNYNLEKINQLETASKLQPENNDVRTELVLANVIINDNEQVDSLTQKLIDSGKYTVGELNYSTDLINSIPENSTLVVHGITELIPTVYTRNQMNRYDLQIISIDLMQSSQYRTSIEGLGYYIPKQTVVDTNFFVNFVQNNTQKNLFISMSFPKSYFQSIAPDLVVYGLSFGYQVMGYDPFNWNLNVYNQLWDKELLQKKQDARSDQLAANYLPCLMNLEKQFGLLNRLNHQIEVQQLILRIAERSQRTKQLNQISR